MKISIITVCYNSAKTIEDTIKSVLSQNYKNYEYIIVDGLSKDNTLDIVKKYEPKFKGKMKIISEKDKGLYDAMNKGIKNSTGDIIGMINSDDVLANSKVFSTIVKVFKETNCDGTYSNLNIMDNETMKKVIRKFGAKKGNYKLGWYPPHPTLYLKKEIYKKYGEYDIGYKIAADYDFMIRIMKNNVKLKYIREVLVLMRSNGKSTDGLKGYKKSFNESLRVLKKNNIKFPFTVNCFRTIKVLVQIIKGKVKKKNI